MNHSAARERITTITNTSHTHQHTRANDELTAASCEIQHSWRLHQRSRDDEVKPRGRGKTSKYGGERWRLTVVLLSSACHSDGRGGRWVEGGRSVLWLERCTRRSSDTDRTRRSLFFFSRLGGTSYLSHCCSSSEARSCSWQQQLAAALVSAQDEWKEEGAHLSFCFSSLSLCRTSPRCTNGSPVESY